MLLIDSDVWSEFFRKKNGPKSSEVIALHHAIENQDVVMIGPIRQEILSGIRTQSTYTKIRNALRAFPDGSLSIQHFETSAAYFNKCRRHGIQGSHTDFLICACSVIWNIQILSKGLDYDRYAKYIPIKQYKPL